MYPDDSVGIPTVVISNQYSEIWRVDFEKNASTMRNLHALHWLYQQLVPAGYKAGVNGIDFRHLHQHRSILKMPVATLNRWCELRADTEDYLKKIFEEVWISTHGWPKKSRQMRRCMP